VAGFDGKPTGETICQVGPLGKRGAGSGGGLGTERLDGKGYFRRGNFAWLLLGFVGRFNGAEECDDLLERSFTSQYVIAKAGNQTPPSIEGLQTSSCTPRAGRSRLSKPWPAFPDFLTRPKTIIADFPEGSKGDTAEANIPIIV
jgi:hypothetical protein